MEWEWDGWNRQLLWPYAIVIAEGPGSGEASRLAI